MFTLNPQESDPTASLEAAAPVPLIRTIRGLSDGSWLAALLFALIPPRLLSALHLNPK